MSRYLSKTEASLGLGGALVALAFMLTVFAAYITHLVWSIKLLMAAAAPVWNQVVLAILGSFVPPVGVIHGLVLWFS